MKTKLLLVLALISPLCAAEQWKTQFFFDKDRASLELHDLQCPSTGLCVAAGALLEVGKNKAKGSLVISWDQGEHWTLQEESELPYSLFFLDGSTGWMVTDRGLWKTQNAAKTWKKLNPTRGMERVWFLDESHGFAVAEAKTIYETTDGGKVWTKIAVPETRPMEAKDVVFDGIAFENGKRGVISGSWNPMQQTQQAEWLEINPSRRPKLSISALLLESVDAGKSWHAYEVKVQGKLTRLRFFDNKSFLLLVEYLGGTEVPSELFQLSSGQAPQPLLHQTGRVGRDMIVLPNGEVVVAAVELQGKSNEVPIPGKLRMMLSNDLKTWHDEKSDYRAVAKRPFLAAADQTHVWVATDTGMILKRVSVPEK